MMSMHASEEQLYDYVDEVLTVDQRTRIERHVAECERCAAELRQIRVLHDSLNALPNEIAPPQDLWSAISSKIHVPPGVANVLPLVGLSGSRVTRAVRDRLPRPWSKRFALVAGIAAVVVASFWMSLPTETEEPAWRVARIDGTPRIGVDHVGSSAELGVGDWLETDGVSRARVEVGSIGEVQVEPNTRLRMLQSTLTDHRVALAQGTIHATIWAPPRLFFVETPSATAIDLGCAYTLRVDEKGTGTLQVTAGLVALELAGRSSVIPAGAQCETRPGVGPGTPYYADATSKFKNAIMEFDFAGFSMETLQVLLDEARPQDALTLFHLLSRVQPQDRTKIYDRLALLAPPPDDVNCKGIVEGNGDMFRSWSKGLGLADYW